MVAMLRFRSVYDILSTVSNNMTPIIFFVPLICLISCMNADKSNIKTFDTSNYSVEDFKTVRKFDIHVHINAPGKTMINLARAYNFRLLNVAVDVSSYPPMKEQISVREKHFHEDPDLISFGTAFTLDDWDHPDWSNRTIDQLKNDFSHGAVAVKTWKNIGMEARDKAGNLITLDDPKFDPVIQFIEDQGKVLLSHAGEPKNCWLPLNEMTVKNDRDYFSENPIYHMYLHPEMPSYQEQIDQRDSMLAKHPNIPFVGFHMASLEWSVDRLAAFLDRFPNARVDLAERISHTQYQSQQDREKVRAFFVKYQDRIIYATDFQENEDTDLAALEKHMLQTWINDWRYFNTDEMVDVPQLEDPVKGLALPKNVVNKIYWDNAAALFPHLTSK